MEQAQGINACLTCPLAICIDEWDEPAGVEIPEHCTSDLARKVKKKAYDKAYRGTHREEIKAQQKIYRGANKEKMAKQNKLYYKANSEQILARQKAVREAKKNAKKGGHHPQNRRATPAVGSTDAPAKKHCFGEEKSGFSAGLYPAGWWFKSTPQQADLL